MKPLERTIVYALLGFFLAWGVVITFWLNASLYPQLEFMFNQRIESEEYQTKIRMLVESEIYRYQEAQKGVKNVNEKRE